MKYMAVQKLKNVLFRLNDTQYAEFYHRLQVFDPSKVDPAIKAKLLSDLDKTDDTGAMKEMAVAVFEDHNLMREARDLMTELSTRHD